MIEVDGYQPNREWGCHPDFLKSLKDIEPLGEVYSETSIDPRDTLRTEFQGPQGACQGFSLSSIVEWCYMLAKGDSSLEGVQLSPAFAYYESQRLDRLNGSDRGSTISGGCKLATTTGIPEEKFWKYPKKYDNRRPDDFQDVLANAEQYKASTLRKVKTYDDIRNFLGAAVGAVNLGIRWSKEYGAVIEKIGKKRGGGHAVALISLSTKKDAVNRPYVWLLNSWGKRWGNRGWSEVKPAVIAAWLRERYTTAIGISELPNIAPRKFSLEDWRNRITAI